MLIQKESYIAAHNARKEPWESISVGNAKTRHDITYELLP